MTTPQAADATSDHDCTDCPMAARRELLLAGALLALPLRFMAALHRVGADISYAIPAADGVTIDKDNGVILCRTAGKVIAFNLSCPHQNTALRWVAEDKVFACPKHKSRYQPDGVFISGRATRNMDRLAIKRDGDTVVVNLDVMFKQDKEATEWAAATVAV